MKTRLHILAGTMLALLAGAAPAGEEAHPKATKDVMKFKLHYAQRVLEGIATENFAVIADNARKLKGLSQQADWRIRQTAEYQKFTGDFARAAELLEKAAAQENVDAATVAYFQLTVSCTHCHRSLRGEKAVGSMPVPPEHPTVGLAALDFARHHQTQKMP